jgi:ubiquinone/menaquinone biosynthesis C-methylase UbiE
MLRKTKEVIRVPNVSFHKLDGFTLKEFADGCLDFVYSHDVFVQLSSVQVYTYFLEIERVLKTGGVGLVSFYDFVDRFDMFRTTSVKLTAARSGPGARRLHFVTEEMIRTMLADTRLVPMEIQKRRFLTAVFCKSGTDIKTRSGALPDAQVERRGEQ